MNVPVEVIRSGQAEKYIELHEKLEKVRKQKDAYSLRFAEIQRSIEKLSKQEVWTKYFYTYEDVKRDKGKFWVYSLELKSLSDELVEVSGNITQLTYAFITIFDQLKTICPSFSRTYI